MFFGNDGGHPTDTNGKPNSFMEFLQQQKHLQQMLAGNMHKPPGGPPPHGMPSHQMHENNNPQNFQQPPMTHQAIMGNHGPLSVEELEARLRQPGPSANISSNNIPNDMKNSQQQDMIAFKKLVRFKNTLSM